MLPNHYNSQQPITLDAKDVSVIDSAKSFKQAILDNIARAEQRIYITALYLQEDDAGKEILEALYLAKAQKPGLDIKIFVDAHRAQRGLIGEAECLGNRAFYLDIAQQHSVKINIYGVLVKTKELFGVLHLKGLIFDSRVLYTGASINDVYLHQADKCRYDRYHLVECQDLAQSMIDYLDRYIVQPGLAPLLNAPLHLDKKEQKKAAKKQKSLLRRSHYCTKVHQRKPGELTVVPMVGFGARGNVVNNSIRELFKHSLQSITLFTPYFNLPAILAKDLRHALKRGVEVTMVVGDKRANDFYIPPGKDFSKIGIIPYIYEVLLGRFIKRHQAFIDAGKLKIHLWSFENHSFHLKGIVVDNRRHMITGSNLNPRAWSLDLENALLVEDPKRLLEDKWAHELANIMQHTVQVKHSTELESIQDYPLEVREPIRKLQLTQIDRLLKRFL
ncbi:MAG: CDP-diacylglycerol--serine O-phosphatidyltransferase [Pseudomonadales bacterium]